MSKKKKKEKRMLGNKPALTKDVSAHLGFPAFYSYFARKQNPAHSAEKYGKRSKIQYCLCPGDWVDTSQV